MLVYTFGEFQVPGIQVGSGFELKDTILRSVETQNLLPFLPYLEWNWSFKRSLLFILLWVSNKVDNFWQQFQVKATYNFWNKSFESFFSIWSIVVKSLGWKPLLLIFHIITWNMLSKMIFQSNSIIFHLQTQENLCIENMLQKRKVTFSKFSLTFEFQSNIQSVRGVFEETQKIFFLLLSRNFKVLKGNFYLQSSLL